MTPAFTYIIPTRDRPRRLRETLGRLAELGDHGAVGGAEVIVVDNDSPERLVLPRALGPGLSARRIDLPGNLGAASRNIAAGQARGRWLVMLDDDSYPRDLGFAEVLGAQPEDVAAVAADISLPSGAREAGGLPEVFVGCGVAIRREAYLAHGGYDPAMGYYAEEYDLAAKFLLAGLRVTFEPRFRVRHERDPGGRDMDTILARLIRNNGWVGQRYAPEGERLTFLRETRRRYRRIAAKEHAMRGFGAGLVELRRTLRGQARTPMPMPIWDRFTGLTHARAALAAAHAAAPFHSAAIIDAGKNAWVIARALGEIGVRLVGDGEDAGALVIGTMSPGPMLDALARRAKWRGPHAPRVVAPWALPAAASRPRRLAA